MARPLSPKRQKIKQDVLSRLEEGYLRPGDRFYSNRSLAQHFGISYQTAHRLISELEAEGYLQREAGSGTYVAGASQVPHTVEFFFNERSRNPGSFGANLKQRLEHFFQLKGIPHQVQWSRASSRLTPLTYPILWESSSLLGRLLKTAGFGMLISQHPPSGLENPFIDSVEVDDFAGGVLAGQVLRKRWKCRQPMIFAGPKYDSRSDSRIGGFQQVFPGSPIIHSKEWHYESALKVVEKILRTRQDGIFCANDRLAQAVQMTYRAKGKPLPVLMGFDDAPVASEIGLSTIGIPWDDFVHAVAEQARKRLDGDNRTARRVVLAPRVIIRNSR